MGCWAKQVGERVGQQLVKHQVCTRPACMFCASFLHQSMRDLRDSEVRAPFPSLWTLRPGVVSGLRSLHSPRLPLAASSMVAPLFLTQATCLPPEEPSSMPPVVTFHALSLSASVSLSLFILTRIQAQL